MNPPTPVKLRDTAERLFWTFAAAFLTQLLASPVIVGLIEYAAGTTIDLSLVGAALVSAASAGMIAVGNAVLLIARWRLAALPAPGEGLPGARILDVREVLPVTR